MQTTVSEPSDIAGAVSALDIREDSADATHSKEIEEPLENMASNRPRGVSSSYESNSESRIQLDDDDRDAPRDSIPEQE
jgi:hypothetical protein